MNTIIEWFESLFTKITTPTNPMITPIQPVQPIEDVTDPVHVIYDPTPSVVPSAPSKLDLWCKAAIKMEGANPANCNPGNIRYVIGTWTQKMAVRDNGGFCVFKDYETGYSVLRQLFVNAATGKSKIYHPTDTLYVFYSKYAPSSDHNDPNHYASYVASVIGVSPSVQIQTLV